LQPQEPPKGKSSTTKKRMRGVTREFGGRVGTRVHGSRVQSTLWREGRKVRRCVAPSEHFKTKVGPEKLRGGGKKKGRGLSSHGGHKKKKT